MVVTATVLHCKRDARLRSKTVPEAAAQARRFVEETFTRWVLSQPIEDAKLIVPELIGNSVTVTPGAEIAFRVARPQGKITWARLTTS